MVLSRDIAALGIYPAVDPLDSTSRQLDPLVVGADHYDTARACRERCSATRNCATSSPFWAWTAWPDDKLAVARPQDPAFPVPAVPRGRSVHRYSRQVRAAQGNHSRLQDDRGRRCDHLPEQAFYMVGTIDEAFRKEDRSAEGKP